jgi:hypothetical protein
VAVRERATPVAEEQLRHEVACWPQAGLLKKSLALGWLDMPRRASLRGIRSKPRSMERFDSAYRIADSPGSTQTDCKWKYQSAANSVRISNAAAINARV